jgi:LmbE family N-acetylglucosaminyl deacetylase
MPETPLVAMAVAAHPDDIEFTMAGTLLLLKQAGAQIHMWNLANGSCGTATYDVNVITRLRAAEVLASAQIAGAIAHPPVADDLAITYDLALLSRVASVIREVKPDILLLPSPADYMEDHINTCRLVVTAAFARGMRNYVTNPPANPWQGDTVLYHAMPHGLRDGLRRRIQPEYYVDVKAVLGMKREMLSQHATQRDWLDVSQGMGSYVNEMDNIACELGEMSKRFEYAEGWRRHNNLGFAAKGADPLAHLLGTRCWIDPAYQHRLDNELI